MIGAMSSIPKMRWVGLGVGLLGVTAWAIGAWQIGLIQYLLEGLEPMWTWTTYMPHPGKGILFAGDGISGKGLVGLMSVLGRPLYDGLLEGNWSAIWGQILFFAGVGLVYWSAAIIRKH